MDTFWQKAGNIRCFQCVSVANDVISIWCLQIVFINFIDNGRTVLDKREDLIQNCNAYILNHEYALNAYD